MTTTASTAENVERIQIRSGVVVRWKHRNVGGRSLVLNAGTGGFVIATGPTPWGTGTWGPFPLAAIVSARPLRDSDRWAVSGSAETYWTPADLLRSLEDTGRFEGHPLVRALREVRPATIPCPRCDAKGSHTTVVAWSDGLGHAEATCALCGGRKAITRDPVALAVEWKDRAARAEHELAQLRAHVALYLATSKGKLPEPPLILAPTPSPYAETWGKYLEEAAAQADRASEVPLDKEIPTP